MEPGTADCPLGPSSCKLLLGLDGPSVHVVLLACVTHLGREPCSLWSSVSMSTGSLTSSVTILTRLSRHSSPSLGALRAFFFHFHFFFVLKRSLSSSWWSWLRFFGHFPFCLSLDTVLRPHCSVCLVASWGGSLFGSAGLRSRCGAVLRAVCGGSGLSGEPTPLEPTRVQLGSFLIQHVAVGVGPQAQVLT